MSERIRRANPIINGVTLAMARRIARYTFGEFVFNVVYDEENIEYKVFLFDTLDGEEPDLEAIKFFSEYWGREYKFFTVNTKPE